MSIVSRDIQQQGPPHDSAKEQRAWDAAQAMREYHAEKLAVQARSDRLRKLRLAKEAASPPSKTTKRSAKQGR